MTDVYATIRQAILDKRQVVAMYKGHRRELCPQVIGTFNGRERVLAIQCGGTSSRELSPDGDWRCMDIDGLTEVGVREGAWYSKSHSAPLRCIDEVDVQVAGFDE